MNLLRRLFSRNAYITASACEDDAGSYLSRQQGRVFAARECHRDLIETASLISYVRYAEDFDDFCRVEISFDSQERGTYTIQLLPLNERASDERLDDAKIAEVARRDRRVNAVRMYRHLHQCSLAEAIQGVVELERNSDNVRAESK